MSDVYEVQRESEFIGAESLAKHVPPKGADILQTFCSEYFLKLL